MINEPEKIWPNGIVIGFHGEMCYVKNKGLAVVVLSNCTIADAEGDPVKEILNSIIDFCSQ